MKARTPPDPVTGHNVMDLDCLELIRRLCTQIPAPRQHLVRYYGWYSNRARGARGEVCGLGDGEEVCSGHRCGENGGSH